MQLSSPALNFRQSLVNNIPGWNGVALAHWLGWFGEGTPVKVHRVNRYVSTDPAVVKAQLLAMQSIGIQGAIATWQGPTVNPFLHAATMTLWEWCMELDMLFGLLLDPWIAKQQPNPTQAVITALQSADCQRMLDSPCYLPEQYVLEFDLAASAGVVVPTVQAAVGCPLLSWHTGFSWPNIPVNPQSPTDSLASLKADNAQTAMKVCGVNVAFNDGGEPLPVGVLAAGFAGLRDYSISAWGAAVGNTRVIDHQGGNWFFDQLAVMPKTAPYVALVTWNDSDEGTGIEHVVAALTGNRIGQ
jgi:hypothetical protein